MELLPQLTTGQIGLLISPGSGKRGYEALLKATAVLAMEDSVRVIVCGNKFNLRQVSRDIRCQTPHLPDILDRIAVARAFTCYQVVTLLRQTPITPEPTLIFDLLATFYDENVSLAESYRLVNIVTRRLAALRRQAPILIGIHPPLQPQRMVLVKAVEAIADHVLTYEPPPTYQKRRLL